MKTTLIALALLTVSCSGKIDGELPEGGLVVDLKPNTPTTPTNPTSPTNPTTPTNPTNPTSPTNPTTPTTPTTPATGVSANPHTADNLHSDSVGSAGTGSNLLEDATPGVVVVAPVAPVALPNLPAAPAAVTQTLICTGRGEPGLTFSSKIEFFSDNSRRFHFSLWNREAVIENFIATEVSGAAQDFIPVPTQVGAPASSKVQHGFLRGYREFLGYAPSASIYQQLFISDDRGGMELRVGQIGDDSKPEFFGLDAARCVKI